MFERYDEKARRVIFFGRYEAGANGSPYIECPHLLLGMLREYYVFRGLDQEKREAIRAGIVARLPRDQPVSTSAELPLSREAKRALSVAAEEAERLGDAGIDSGHLLIGITRVDPSLADLLRRHGIDPEQRKNEDAQVPTRPPAGPPGGPLNRLGDLILRVQTGSRGRKQAMEHLIDWATAHHQILVRALVEPNVTVSVLPDQNRVEGYVDLPWPRLAAAWASLNMVILDLIQHMPADRLEMPVQVGAADPVPLSKIIDAYVEHCERTVRQA